MLVRVVSGSFRLQAAKACYVCNRSDNTKDVRARGSWLERL